MLRRGNHREPPRCSSSWSSCAPFVAVCVAGSPPPTAPLSAPFGTALPHYRHGKDARSWAAARLPINSDESPAPARPLPLGAALAATLFAAALMFAGGQTRTNRSGTSAKPKFHSPPTPAALSDPKAADGREGPSGLGPHDVYHGFGHGGRFAHGAATAVQFTVPQAGAYRLQGWVTIQATGSVDESFTCTAQAANSRFTTQPARDRMRTVPGRGLTRLDLIPSALAPQVAKGGAIRVYCTTDSGENPAVLVGGQLEATRVGNRRVARRPAPELRPA